ncbi:hypothetical protein D3C72_1993150 [compost metagenome]
MGQKLANTELESYRRVDEVLFYLWDPIGVAHSPAARNEYQEYLPKVFAMLLEGASAATISAYLDDAVTAGMGLEASPECATRVAVFLLDWKAEIYRNR